MNFIVWQRNIVPRLPLRHSTDSISSIRAKAASIKLVR
jgi:hypothetical protein